jgi:hypothetical protein
MENQQQSENIFGLTINEVAKQELSTLCTWARITAITAFISYGLGLIAAFVGKQYNEGVNAEASKIGAVISAIVILAIGVPLNLYLLNFTKSTMASLRSSDTMKLEIGTTNLKMYFKFLGILMIIALVLIGLAILFGTLGALVGGLGK